MITSVWKVRVALALLIMQWMYLWCKPRETYVVINGLLPLSDVLWSRSLTSPHYTRILILWWMAAVLLILPACRPSPFSVCAFRWRGAAYCILLHSPHYAVFGMPCVGVMPTLRQCHRLRSFIPYGRNLRQFVVDDSGWTVWYQVSEPVQCVYFVWIVR